MKVMLCRNISSSPEGISCSTIRSFLTQAISTCHIFLSTKLPFGIVLVISDCLFGWSFDTLKTFSKYCSYFLRTAFSSTMFATKRFFSFYFSIRISLISAFEQSALTSDSVTDRNKR